MKILYPTNLRPYIIIALITLCSTLILWLPFILSKNFDTVLRHWDGPLYIIPAKTLYDINNPLIQENILGLGDKYFAAHLPGYPLTLKVLAPFVGYPRATVVATLLASILLFSAFYYVVKKLHLSSKPLFLTLVFMFLTPRFFVVRSVGSPEPLFMLAIILSVYFFTTKKFFFAGLLGALAVITKTPGVLLFCAYFLFLIVEHLRYKKIPAGSLWILLIPAGLLGVFTLYYYQYGDFYAYFHSGDNLHLAFPPYQTFNAAHHWIGTAWLEDILYVYLLYGYTTIELVRRLALHIYRSKNPIASFFHRIKEQWSIMIGLDGYTSEQERFFAVAACFAMIFYVAIISVMHRDISRYSLPLLPFALITFEKFFTSKRFQLLLIILLPAIYMYAWNFMGENVMPNINWTPFL
jgi:Gpi18-like mannosyltransferase